MNVKQWAIDLLNDPNLVISDGTPVDPNAQYFVLRLDTDSHARQAALAYARSIGTFNKKLAIDLLLWVTEIEEKIIKGEQ